MRHRFILAVLLAAAVVLPAGSHAEVAATEAVTISRSGGTVTIVGTAGRDLIAVDRLDRRTTFQIRPPGRIVTGTGCTQRSESGASCSGVAAIVVRLGDGDDGWTEAFGQNVGLTIDAGAGDDRIYSLTNGALRVSGGSGDDDIRSDPYTDRGATLRGGEGDDRLRPGGGRAGRSLIDGGPGADLVFGSGRGRDRIRGGAGRDRIRAVDKRRDRINCGPGVDSLRHDRGLDLLTSCP